MVEKTDVTYVFGEFSLDLAERKFARNGEPVHVPAKEFDTLLYFVQNPGRTLSKDEMMSAIWDETFVEEGNLAQYVSRLRKLIDTNGHNYIKTLPKRGYRFDADVQTVGDVPDPERRRTLWPWGGGRNGSVDRIGRGRLVFCDQAKTGCGIDPRHDLLRTGRSDGRKAGRRRCAMDKRQSHSIFSTCLAKPSRVVGHEPGRFGPAPRDRAW